jgi:hypothetical protein
MLEYSEFEPPTPRLFADIPSSPDRKEDFTHQSLSAIVAAVKVTLPAKVNEKRVVETVAFELAIISDILMELEFCFAEHGVSVVGLLVLGDGFILITHNGRKIPKHCWSC